MIDPARKLLWHADKIAALRDGARPGVINVEIDLSNRCSLGCEWCHFAHTHTRGPLAGTPGGDIPGGDLMDTDLALRILAQLTAAGVQSVTWTGGGEPTLHPRFDTITEACRLPQGLYTHGGHIPRERAWRLKQRLTWIYVSLDEVGRDAYRASKGVDRYEEVLAGVRRLVGARGTATIGLGFLLHAGNWREMERMLGLGRALGVDYVQFRPTVRYELDRPAARVEAADWVSDALDAMPDDPLLVVDRARFAEYRDWQGHGYARCHWAALQTVITPNGMVWTCVNRREDRGSLLGDLSHEPWADVAARIRPHLVDDHCRIMCRGHVANVALDSILRRPAHAEFV